MKTNHSIRSAVAALIHALALRVAPSESREGAQTKAPAAPSTPPDLAQGKLRTVAAHGQRPGVDRASILESLSALASSDSTATTAQGAPLSAMAGGASNRRRVKRRPAVAEIRELQTTDYERRLLAEAISNPFIVSCGRIEIAERHLPTITQVLADYDVLRSAHATAAAERDALKARLEQVERDLSARVAEVEAERTRVEEERDALKVENETMKASSPDEAKRIIETGVAEVQRLLGVAPAGREDFQTLKAQVTQLRAATPRAVEMLRVAARYCEGVAGYDHGAYDTIEYDGAECDGQCVSDDCLSAADGLARALAVGEEAG